MAPVTLIHGWTSQGAVAEADPHVTAIEAPEPMMPASASTP
jgi:hypothetical protein